MRRLVALPVFVMVFLIFACEGPVGPPGPAGAPGPPVPSGPQEPVSNPDPVEHPVFGIVIAPESREVPYYREAYDYPASIERDVIDNQGGHFSPYTLRCFDDPHDTQIDHIVALAEAHDSGMGTRTDSVKVRFARDLDNLTTTAPSVNSRKSDKDPAEWLPEHNRCWYLGVWIEVKRKYGLTMDQAEADAILGMLGSCSTYDLPVPSCAIE